MMPQPLLADIGLPMVALYVPLAWLALIPIAVIESLYGARRYELKFSRAFLAEATANCVTTIIGIPTTWLALVLIQAKATPSGIGPAWLGPDANGKMVVGAFLGLTVVFYIMSVIGEALIVRFFFRRLPRGKLWQWMIGANAISYLFLLAVFFAGMLAPTMTGTVFKWGQPITDQMVEGAAALAGRVSSDYKKESPLIEAIAAGSLRKVQKLVAEGADPNQANEFGYPALELAAQLDDPRIAKLLLGAGAKVNARSTSLKDTALASATRYGSLETVKMLLDAHADVEASDGAGWTPLFDAAMRGKPEIVDQLISAGANVNAFHQRMDGLERSAASWLRVDRGTSKSSGCDRITDDVEEQDVADFELKILAGFVGHRGARKSRESCRARRGEKSVRAAVKFPFSAAFGLERYNVVRVVIISATCLRIDRCRTFTPSSFISLARAGKEAPAPTRSSSRQS